METTAETLSRLTETAAGWLYPDAIRILDSTDWGSWYPIVDSNGRLTGGVARADDPHYIVVDYQSDALVSHTIYASDAMLPVDVQHDCGMDEPCQDA